jgi:hypothetical protein
MQQQRAARSGSTLSGRHALYCGSVWNGLRGLRVEWPEESGLRRGPRAARAESYLLAQPDAPKLARHLLICVFGRHPPKPLHPPRPTQSHSLQGTPVTAPRSLARRGCEEAAGPFRRRRAGPRGTTPHTPRFPLLQRLLAKAGPAALRAGDRVTGSPPRPAAHDRIRQLEAWVVHPPGG